MTSLPPPQHATKKPRPVLIVMSIMAGLQALVGAAAFTEAVSSPWAGLVMAVVAAVQIGMAFYVQGKVTPVD